MKLKNYILAVYLLFVSLTVAQENLNILKYYDVSDSIEVDPYSFLPMQVDNFWQYAFLNEVVNEETVTKDSVLSNLSKVIWIKYNNFEPQPIWIIDTLYQVLNWIPDTSYWQGIYFKLNAKLNEEWWVARFSEDTTRGIVRKVESVFEAEYLGMNTIFKEIVEYARDSDGDYLRHKYLLGSGLGIVQKRNDSMVEPPEYLLAAIIDGDTLGTIVGINDDFDDYIPRSTKLFQNYPNPFNSETTITYNLSKPGTTKLVIFNVLGERIKTLVNQFQSIGNYSYKINLKGLPSGIYICTLISSKIISSIKITYLK